MDWISSILLNPNFIQPDWVFKLIVLVLLVGHFMYLIALLLRIRILLDTFSTSFDNKIRMLSVMYMIIVFVGGLVGAVFVLII